MFFMVVIMFLQFVEDVDERHSRREIIDTYQNDEIDRTQFKSDFDVHDPWGSKLEEDDDTAARHVPSRGSVESSRRSWGETAISRPCMRLADSDSDDGTASRSTSQHSEHVSKIRSTRVADLEPEPQFEFSGADIKYDSKAGTTRLVSPTTQQHDTERRIESQLLREREQVERQPEIFSYSEWWGHGYDGDSFQSESIEESVGERPEITLPSGRPPVEAPSTSERLRPVEDSSEDDVQ